MNKFRFLLISLCLVQFVFGFKLNNTFSHPNGVYKVIGLNSNLPNVDYSASSGTDGSIKIWDVANEMLKFTFDRSNGGHTGKIESLASLKNGFLAVSPGAKHAQLAQNR